MKKTFLIIFAVMLLPICLFAGREWTIVAQYPIPESSSGLAWDGTYLYSGIYGSNGGNVYRIDPSDGSYSLHFTGSQGDAYGMTYDGQYLVIVDHQTSISAPAIAMKFSLAGIFMGQIDLPDHYMSGIAYDNGDYWCSTYYDPDGWIYKVNESGSILKDFAAPDNQPWDLCIENGNLWMVDYWGDALYAIDPTSGALMETHASEHSDPAGVVYDGQYLWYCDNGSDYNNDWLYKVDLGGAGTPVINVPNTQYPFGTVTVGETATWNCYVYSAGTGNLEITDITLSGLNASDVTYDFTLPATILPGDNTYIPFTYAPDEAGSLNCTATIYSNDPLSPEVYVTLTGDAVNSGPSIYLPSYVHNYGTVRANSYNRWYIQVQNIGDEDLNITNVYSSNPSHFVIDDGVEVPIELNPLETIELGLWFSPAAGINYNEIIYIDSNDPAQPCTEVTVTGEGDIADYPIGEQLWYYYITGGWDNSIKAIASIPDINGDNVADVIVCSEDYFVRCFNGNSCGLADVLWELEIPTGSLSYQKELSIIKDVNGDGYLDVVVGTPWGDRSIHVINGKTGEIIWTHDTHEYGGGGWVYQVDCDFDYNGDGIVDVLAATGDDGDTHTGPQRVYCLDGTDGESIWEFFMPGPKFSVIGIEDVNNDDIPDVVAGASDQSELNGTVYGINGANGSQLWSYGVFGTSVWALGQLDDINDDGIKDVAAGDFSGHFYYLSGANGNVIDQGYMGNVLILHYEVLDDVNGDGYKDIIAGHSGTSGIVYNGFNASAVWAIGLADKSWNVARIEDISGDGINDVIIGTLFASNWCYFMDGTNGDILNSFNFGPAVDGINAIPDIVGDNSMEMVVGGRDGSLRCYSGGLNAFVSVNEEPVAPNLLLTDNHPNPFTESTTISFSRPSGQQATTSVKIYNLIGQLVNDFTLEPDLRSFTWNGKDSAGNEVSSGIYLYTLTTGSYSTTSKMILIK